MNSDPGSYQGIKGGTTMSGLILGVDGGGSKALALIASVDENGQMNILGRGRGGPSNLLLSGKEQSLASLNQAVDEAIRDAKMEGQQFLYGSNSDSGLSSQRHAIRDPVRATGLEGSGNSGRAHQPRSLALVPRSCRWRHCLLAT